MDILDFYTFKYTVSTIFSKHSVIHSDKFIHSLRIFWGIHLGCLCGSNGSVVTLGCLRKTRASWLLFYDNDIMVRTL